MESTQIPAYDDDNGNGTPLSGPLEVSAYEWARKVLFPKQSLARPIVPLL